MDEAGEDYDASVSDLREHAAMWDRFLEFVRCTQTQWAPPEQGTDSYRKARALEYFNLANAVAHDLHKLNPGLSGW
eukprot:6031189-Pleurochrysis_carterae.AAC.1